MKSTIIIFSSLFSLNYLAQSVPCSSTIRVGTSCTGHSCTTPSVNVVAFNTYTANVLTNEWGQWGAWTNGIQSLNAGSVAIRSYALNRINYPISAHGNNANYDICNTTYCHVYNSSVTPSTYATTAVSNTVNSIIVTSSGNVAQTEFAAETNDNCTPVQTSGEYCGQCGDGKFQRSVTGPPLNGGGCYPSSGTDPVCIGKTNSGHPRGMCQRGSVRWATGYTVPSNTNIGTPHSHGTKTWQELLDYYYPYWSRSTCSGGITPPPNDNCSDAIVLNSSNGYCETGQTVVGATHSYGANQCTGCACTSADDNDVYYKFIATNTSHTITVSNIASNFDAVIEIRDACAGGYITCYDPTNYPDPVTHTFSGLTSGTLYYIRVFEGNNAATPPSSPTFDVCCEDCGGNDPDLQITSASITDPTTTYCHGEMVHVDYTIENKNSNATVSIETLTGFYLVPVADGCPSTIPSDPVDDEGVLVTEMSNNIDDDNEAFNIPANTPPGDYYIVLIADFELDLNETNEPNNFHCELTITVLPEPLATINGDLCFENGQSTTLSIETCAGCSYEWSNSSTGTSINVNATGIYSVTVTVGGICTASEQVEVTVCPGINSAKESIDFLIYPNPNNGSFTVQLETNTAQVIQISIFNLVGQNIYETEALKVAGEYRRDIDLRNAAAGMYFVNVRVGEERGSEKIIIR